MAYTVEPLSPDSYRRWNDCVRRFDGALFHTTDWLGLYARAGFQDTSIFVLREGEVAGLLPVVSLKIGPIRKAYSLPLCASGLLAPDPQGMWEVIHAFLSSKVDSHKITSITPLPNSMKSVSWRSVRVDLARPEEKIHSSFRTNLRAKLRQAAEASLELREVETSAEIAEVWRLYHETMARKHSGGSYWPGLFEDLLGLPRETRRILVAYRGGEAMAFNAFLRFGSASQNFATGSSHSHHNLHAVDFLLWKNLLWAKEKGSTVAYLGSGHTQDGNDSLFDFKKKWGEPHFTYIAAVALSWKGRAAEGVESLIGDSLRRRIKPLVLKRVGT